ncbi:putative metal-binding protein [Geoglobus ahangari]|uniref:Putative metal-binding protein n=1 Tax=Geoglobus ahangari TaxID=113653 RepID=A0A0F7IG70_9EURY|nr:ASKHA domain-containing protein [Geoglobus ahangari]AKG91867.1 putative metal-binding protein [Geoglobus ahangari]
MVKVVFLPSGKRAEAEKGKSILEIAQSVGEGIRSLCGGKGSCGKCKVIVRNGEYEINPEPHEKFVSKKEREKGVVLACQTYLMSDAEIYIPLESRLEKQQILKDFIVSGKELQPDVRKEFYADAFLPEVLSKNGYRLSCSPEVEDGDLTLVLRGNEVIAVEEGDTRNEFYGLAIDIGTTTLVTALVDLNTGNVVNIASDYNGQIIYGEEVLSRVEFVFSRKDGLEILQKAVVESINKLVDRLLEGYSSPEKIYDVVAAGNTLMTHFFLGMDINYLFKSSNVRVEKKGYTALASQLGLKVNENALVFALPPVGRYVGGDIVGDVLASGVVDSPYLSLMVDLGTNGEIVLGSEGWAISTSVASGPAFEGYEIKHGSRAVEGAIDHVEIVDGEVKYTVIGNKKPRSICGSGLIDLLAELLKNGIVDFQGNLDTKHPRVRRGEDGYEFVVVEGSETETGEDIVFTQNDIDTLIKSKAAVCAGIAVLIKKAGITPADVDRFYIAGGFGYYINFENAVIIGLFPELPNAEVRQIGNGSLAGAYLALTSRKKRQLAETMAKLMTYFDLSTDANFMEEYNAALALPGKYELFPTIYSKYV